MITRYLQVDDFAFLQVDDLTSFQPFLQADDFAFLQIDDLKSFQPFLQVDDLKSFQPLSLMILNLLFINDYGPP